MKKLVLMILGMASFAVTAAPEQFQNINALMENYNDYQHII